MLYGHIGIASMRQFQCVPTTCVSENKKTVLKFTFIPSIMSLAFASFKHLKLPISIKMHVSILQIVYVCMTATTLNSSS